MEEWIDDCIHDSILVAGVIFFLKIVGSITFGWLVVIAYSAGFLGIRFYLSWLIDEARYTASKLDED